MRPKDSINHFNDMLMNYNNPDEAWYHGLKQRPQGEGCLLSMVSVTFLALAIALLLSFSGCTTKERVVTVPEVHELHHWHSDTIRQTDSVVNNQTTVIREVDSATMAQYGIRLDKAQRAWLIQNDRLQREIERLQSISNTSDTVRDSIPVPYPVEKLVPRERSKVEWVLIVVGILSLMILIINVANKIRKFLP